MAKVGVRALERRFGWIAFLALVSMFGAGSTNCKKKGVEPKPVPEAGEILLTVKQRQTPQAKPHEILDLGGIATAEYKLENGPNFSESRTRSFTGILRIPVRVQADQHFLSIDSLLVADPQGKQLVRYEGADLRRLKDSARFGVTVRVIVTMNGAIDPAVDEIPNDQPPPGSDPVTEFISIKKEFNDPSVILTTTDIEGTLRRLQGIASATEEYHRELNKLVQDAESIDLAHLNLVADAVYFTLEAREAIARQYEELSKDGISGDEEKDAERLRSNLSLADRLGQYVNAIIGHGVRKLAELSYDEAKALIARLYSGWTDADFPIRGMLEKLGELDAGQQVELLNLALAKGAEGAASGLAVTWFDQHSDRKVETLLALVSKFSYGNKDTVLAGTLSSLGDLSAEEAVRISNASYDQKLAIAKAVLRKVKPVSAAAVASIAGTLSYGSKDALITDGLSLLASLTSNETALLMGSAYDQALAIGRLALPKVTDLTAASLARLAGILSYGAKDALLADGLPRLGALSFEEAVTLIRAAYDQQLSVAKTAMAKIPQLTAAGVVSLAAQLSYGSKDAILRESYARLSGLTVADVQSLARAAYSDQYSVAATLLPKIASLDAAGVKAVATMFNYDQLDQLLTQGMGLLSRMSPADIALLANASYSRKKKLVLDGDRFVAELTTAELKSLIAASADTGSEVALKYLPKLSDLTAANAVSVAGALTYGSKDVFLAAAYARLASVTVSEAQSLIRAAYEQGFATARALLPKIASLDAAGVKAIATLFSYSQLDQLLAQGMGLLTRMSVAEIALLANSSYSTREKLVLDGDKFVASLTTDDVRTLIAASGETDTDVALKYLPKVSDLTASNAARIASALTYGSKNTFVQTVIRNAASLTTEELITLANATYQQADTVLTGQLSKLSDFTADNALRIAGLLTYGNKDTVILAYMARVQAINTATLVRLARGTYEASVRVIFENVLKISDLTVSNAVTLSKELTYSNKDRLLLIAVDRVTDLTPTNALELSRAGYAQQSQILEKALKRLEENG